MLTKAMTIHELLAKTLFEINLKKKIAMLPFGIHLISS
jgi:hypothetical protein